MNIKKSHLRNEQIKLTILIQWIKIGFHWVKSLWQEQASGDYYWFGKSPFFMDELIDTCSQR
jgi:hypothetical protein